MGQLLDEVNKLRQFIADYGTFEEVSQDQAAETDENHVWTLWSRGNDFISNGYSEDDEIITYFSTPNAWKGEPGSLSVVLTQWLDCPNCDENSDNPDWDQDDCNECEGAGVLSIDFMDCLNLNTEEEILNNRSA